MKYRIKQTAVCGAGPDTKKWLPLFSKTAAAGALGVVLAGSFAILNTVEAAPTVTSLFGGLTTPANGVILPGAAIDPATGSPVRHLWFADSIKGFCRVDPALGATGPSAPNPLACFRIGGAAVPNGPAVYDPTTNYVYIADGGVRGLGIVRVKYDPAGDGGQGLMLPATSYVLGEPAAVTAATPTTDGCGLGAKRGRLSALALGPDGNLYAGLIKVPNIFRITAPTAPLVGCNSFATIAQANGLKRTDGGFAFVGNDLYGYFGATIFKVTNATACVGSAAGGCGTAPAVLTTALPVGTTPYSIISDQIYPATNGSTLYIAGAVSISKVTNPGSPAPVITQPWATGPFAIPTSQTVDPGNSVLYVADDPALGLAATGSMYSVAEVVVPTVPSAPAKVTATSGDGSALLVWTAGPAGSSPITSYTISILDGTGAPSGLPDVTVTRPTPAEPLPTTATISGLTNGSSYTFSIVASNAVGNSTAATSGAVTPQVLAISDAPAAPTVVPGNGALEVSWTAPAFTGNQALTGYTVTCTDPAAAAIVRNVQPSVTAVLLSGLTNDTAYNCSVTASNGTGVSASSLVTSGTPLATGSNVDVAVTGAGPATVTPLANAIYTFTASNNVGNFNVPKLQLAVSLPAAGFATASVSGPVGSCTRASATSYVCDLGPIAAGAAPIPVAVNLTGVSAQVTVTATASALDLSGTAVSENNPGNNAASVTTTLNSSCIPTAATMALRSNRNGVPAVNTNVNHIWTASNTSKTTAANCVNVSFQLPGSIRFTSVAIFNGRTTTPVPGATCTGPAVGTLGGLATCTLATPLAPGASVDFTVIAQPTVGGVVVNSVGRLTWTTLTNPQPNVTNAITYQPR